MAVGNPRPHEKILSFLTSFPMLKSIIILAIIFIGAYLFLRSRITPTHDITVADIPQAFSKLQSIDQDATFVVFMFVHPEAKGPDSEINIQFSRENGAIGLDWVLLAPLNIKDQEKVKAYIQAQGYEIYEAEGNGVKYLRADKGDHLDQLCQKLLKDLYGLETTAQLSMIVEGITWP